MNIRIYSEERKETNIDEYEYIHLQIFEYIGMGHSWQRIQGTSSYLCIHQSGWHHLSGIVKPLFWGGNQIFKVEIKTKN